MALPARAAEPAIWTGHALGADARIVLRGADPHHARHLFAKIEAEVFRVESHFSLFIDSSLTRLNRDGRLSHPTPAFTEIVALTGKVFNATGGAFDPTIQPLWQAIATGGDVEAARRVTGWHRVRFAVDDIRLDPGMALTFNGIAQGYAADRVADLLRRAGFTDVLVDMGEVVALGRNHAHDWQAAVATPEGRELIRLGLSDRALATSSPMGTRIGTGTAHILHPTGQPPLWSTVAVSADRAATADALSTAFCLMDESAIRSALTYFTDARVEVIG
jgi:thiamine biosynthesis lipoprotein